MSKIAFTPNASGTGTLTIASPNTDTDRTLTLPDATGELYNQGNAVGTVSQSAGVPTGALIGSGSNANGSYTRLADGTQMCWHTFSITPSGANTPTLATWTFPIAFSAAPIMHVSVVSTVPGTTVTGWSAGVATTTTSPVYVTRTNTTTTVMLVYAIGRWF